MAHCYHCGTQFPPELRVERSSECPSCHRDLRVCKNCRHYSPGSYQDCRETIPDPVLDKERGNFCDYFSLAGNKGPGNESQADRDRATRKRFESLFRDSPDE